VKTLFLLRHAKSSWDDPELADFDRPLNNRGRKAAKFIGELIADRGIAPRMIVSSPAERARQTAELVTKSADLPKVRFDDRIYEASALSLFHVIGEFPDDRDPILLVGHNPGMEELLRLLTGQVHEVPTAALIGITLDVPRWSDIAVSCGHLEFIVRPKDLMPS
jgi:phosphohistidine phosphatase